jgi:hypothetical protein
MSGINYHTAETVNASTAGLTHTNRPRILSTDLGASPSEIMGNVATNVGGLGFLFGHGIIDVVSTALHPATDSIKTALGGMMRPQHYDAGQTLPPVDGSPELDNAIEYQGLPTVVDTLRGVTGDTAATAKNLFQSLRTSLGI